MPMASRSGQCFLQKLARDHRLLHAKRGHSRERYGIRCFRVIATRFAQRSGAQVGALRFLETSAFRKRIRPVVRNCAVRMLARFRMGGGDALPRRTSSVRRRR